MPYSISMQDGKHCVTKKGDGKKMGCHGTHDEAMKQMQALHANEAMDYAVWVDPFAYTKGNAFRVFPIGTFKRGDRTIELTPARLQTIAQNYNSGHPRWKIPIYPGHPTDANPDPAKFGNAISLEFRENDGLYAHPEYTEDGEKSVEGGKYQYVSPGIIWSGYMDEQGNEVPDVIDHIALTNRPFFGQRTAIFSSDDSIMKSNDTFGQIKDAFTDFFRDFTKSKIREVADHNTETQVEETPPPTKGMSQMPEPTTTTQPTVDQFDAKAQVDQLTAMLKTQADQFTAQLNAEKQRADEFAAKLAGEQRIREVNELKRQAESFVHLPIRVDEYAEKFYVLRQANPDLAKWFQDRFAQFETMLAQGELFGQVSRANAQEAEAENIESFTEKLLADEFKNDRSKYADAFVEAGKRRPDLVPADLRSRNPRR